MLSRQVYLRLLCLLTLLFQAAGWRSEIKRGATSNTATSGSGVTFLHAQQATLYNKRIMQKQLFTTPVMWRMILSILSICKDFSCFSSSSSLWWTAISCFEISLLLVTHSLMSSSHLAGLPVHADSQFYAVTPNDPDTDVQQLWPLIKPSWCSNGRRGVTEVQQAHIKRAYVSTDRSQVWSTITPPRYSLQLSVVLILWSVGLLCGVWAYIFVWTKFLFTCVFMFLYRLQACACVCEKASYTVPVLYSDLYFSF